MRTWTVLAFAVLSVAATACAPAASALEERKASEVTEARFWQIVGESARKGMDQQSQADGLRAALDRLTPREIEAFADIFEGLMRQSYRWDLWGAGFVVEGGMSDDGFEYFRRWLISRGKAAFDKVSADPDALGDIIPHDQDGDFEFEEFGYIAREVWAKKTGRDAEAMPSHARPYSHDPSGAPFSEDSAALRKRYPKLWARFGTD
ncbi:DUF4240 domain-containing protein [Sphingomonas sp. ZT3P38]